MNTLRILFITTAFPPYEFSEALVNAKLVMALKAEGHDIQVVSRPATIVYTDTWSGTWDSFQEDVYYPNSGETSKSKKIAATVRGLLRYKLPVEGIRWGLEAERLANKLHREKAFDLIMTRMPSLFPHLLGVRLSKAWNVPVISNWNDPTDDIRPLGEGVSRKKSFFLKYISRKTFKSAAVNTFPSKNLLQHYLQTNLRGLTAHTEIIPHIGFYADFPLDHTPGQIAKIAHAGNMLENIQLDLLMQSLHAILSKGLRFEFHIFGIVQEKLRDTIEKLGLQEAVIIHTPLSYAEMIRRLVTFDFLMLLEAQYPEGVLMLSKLSDYASLRKPIIALSPRQGVTRDYLAGESGFHVFDNTNQKEIEYGLECIVRKFPEVDHPKPDNKLWRSVMPDAIVKSYKRIFQRLNASRETAFNEPK